jgi:pilus assembly protein CpaF
MVPHRPTGSSSHAVRKSGSVQFPQGHSFGALKARVLLKLEDRLTPSTSKRMPLSLLRQSITTHAEQIADQEARNLSRPERDRLVDEVLTELLGYGPIEELFKDPAVREIMITGPHMVISRREQGPWLPTSVKFRDEEHVRGALDRMATHADPIGGSLKSLNFLDMQLPNGFRVVAIIPPPALGQPATASFIRTETTPAPTEPGQPAPPGSSIRLPVSPSTSGSTATTRDGNGSSIKLPQPGNEFGTNPPGHSSTDSASSSSTDLLGLHRKRIIERLISKMASLGIYDLQKVEITELRRVVTAYVREYVEKERIYLSETDQCRLMLEILAAMQR